MATVRYLTTWPGWSILNVMSQTKTYHCTCPVCRKGHDVIADFMSSPRTLIDTEGQPGLSMSCGAHTPAELQAAWRAR